MTFSLVMRQPRADMLIGAHEHAVLISEMPNTVRWMLRSRKWTCNVCGVRLPGLMEVDHFDAHETNPENPRAPICQFCHDLKHPLWAATRHRLVPVYMTAMGQTTFTRLCWVMISRALHEEQGAERLRPIIEALMHRRMQAGRMLRTLNMTEAFEALFGVADRDGYWNAGMLGQRIDTLVLMMPAAVLDISKLCQWTGVGFEPVSRPALCKATKKPLPLDETADILDHAMYFAGLGRTAEPAPLLPIRPASSAQAAPDAAGAAAAQDETGDAACGDADPEPTTPIRLTPPAQEAQPAREPAFVPEEEQMEP